jgi:hypothetical protein
MISLSERELVRARWRRALAAHALNQADRADFAEAGLARRLESITTQLLLLPADPESATLNLDAELSEWLTGHQVVPIDEIGVRMSSSPNIRRTAHALALADGHEATWRSYLAVHRSGALEIGMGDIGGWEGRNNLNDPIRTISLAPVVARTWAMLTLAADLAARHSISGPFQLTVGIRSQRAHLGMLAEGWAEPDSFENRVGTCPEHTLLWHIELEDLSDLGQAQAVAYAVGDRIEDAWGVAQRRYLAHRGEREGRLDPRRIN